MSSATFSKENLVKESDAGDGRDADLGTWGSVRILIGMLITGAVAGEATLYGSFKEKSSDKLVEGKRWSTFLAVTGDRKVKKIIPATQFVRLDINVDLLEESRNLMP